MTGRWGRQPDTIAVFSAFTASTTLALAQPPPQLGKASPEENASFEESAAGAPAVDHPGYEARHEALPPPTQSTEALLRPIWSIPIGETVLLFTGMRVTEAYMWPDPFSFERVSDWPDNYERALTMPPKFDSSQPFMRWDGDRWQINVIGHGLLGSELYLRPRRCRFGVLGALGFATAASAVWDYAFEANGVRPSGVDLWYTPLSGLLLGEARFQAWRAAGSIRSSTLRHVIRAAVDPVGQFSTEFLDLGC